MSKTVSLKDKFPNEAKFVPGEARALNEDNFYKDVDIESVRRDYVKFTVLMETLYDVLELNRTATMEEFAIRIRDLCMAAVQGEADLKLFKDNVDNL